MMVVWFCAVYLSVGGVVEVLGAVFVMLVWFCAVCLRCLGAVFVMLVWFCAVCECECVWGGGGVEVFWALSPERRA